MGGSSESLCLVSRRFAELDPRVPAVDFEGRSGYPIITGDYERADLGAPRDAVGTPDRPTLRRLFVKLGRQSSKGGACPLRGRSP